MAPSLLSRRSFLKASATLVVVGVAGNWARGLVLPGARADTGKIVLTEDLKLGVAELGGGSLSGTKLEGQKLVRAARGAGEYVSPELRSNFPASHVGVHWRGDKEGSAVFWVRGSRDGVHWTGWEPITVEAGHSREPTDETAGALVRMDAAEHIQFRIRLQDSGAEAAIEAVTVTVLNAEDGPLATPMEVTGAAAPTSKPLTYSREAWGANEALRFDGGDEVWPRSYVPTKKVVVHHTATSNSYSSTSQAHADVRAIYTYHTVSLGWGDIGYCWVIDKFGNSYEGRRGRDGPGYDGPGGRELVSEDVVAGHALNHNHGSCGVALLGNFESTSHTSAMLSKLRDVLAWECSRHGISPQASSDFLRVDDVWNRGLENICGHRDTYATSCPGSKTYALLPSLRADTASRLAVSGAPTVAIQSAPAQGTRTDRNVSYSWQGSGGSGSKQYSYYLEGWTLDAIGVAPLSGYTAALEPAWGPWAAQTETSYILYQPGHYTFHVRVRDGAGKISVYEDTRTLLANVTPIAPPPPFPDATPQGYLPGIGKG